MASGDAVGAGGLEGVPLLALEVADGLLEALYARSSDVLVCNFARGLMEHDDVVTLFHLCEFRSEQTDGYGGLTDLEVTNLLTEKTAPGGRGYR